YVSKPRIRFSYGSAKEFMKIPFPAKKKKIIFVGNSGDAGNNHLEIIEQLAQKRDIDEYRIVIPLAYNLTSDYGERIIASIQKHNLKDKCCFIYKMLPPHEYFALLSEAELLITAHNRQQALGNLIA